MPIDLRSDTVTRPTPAMRRAMAEAEVGDDLYGEDPTVRLLQQRAAALLGFEEALFMPSGTMANQVAIRILTRPGDEVLVDALAHVIQFELAGMSTLSGVMPRTVTCPDGRMTGAIVRSALRPRATLRSDLTLAVVENTHNLAGGTVMSVPEMREVLASCREAGLRVHLDGARLWNAAVALGVEPRELALGADTLMVSLSKGLCAPVGSLLLMPESLLEHALRVRKLLGGGMRQVGVLAAAGLVGLETMRGRLGEDHEGARRIAKILSGTRGGRVAPVETNIVVVNLREAGAPALAQTLAARGILVSAMGTHILRLVTHHDVSTAECETAAGALRQLLDA